MGEITVRLANSASMGLRGSVFLSLTLVNSIAWSADKATPLNAGEIQPGQVPQERKVYVNSESTVFWPLDRPFWIRLSSTPDDSGQSVLLSQVLADGSQSSKTDGSQNIKANVSQGVKTHQEGIRLEIPGKQFVRWMNFYSKTEALYRFIADGGPPTVEIQYKGAPQVPTPSELIFGRNLLVSLSAKDEHSGVQNIGYSINGGPFAWYREPFPMAEDGTYKINFYALDRVGYASKFETAQLKVDLTPPLTQLSNRTKTENKTIGPREQFYLSPQDAVSGVKASYYRIDKGSELSGYSKPITLDNVTEGDHILYYFSEDQAQNREIPKEYSFYLVRIAPNINHAFVGDLSMKGSVAIISPRTKTRLDVSEGHSKAKIVTYQFCNN